MRAGSLSVDYLEGSLRYFRFGNREILRRLYPALRDPNWRTAVVTRTNEQIDEQEDAFRISYDWYTEDLGLHMRGTVVLTGAADGTVTFDWTGEALSAFSKNRLGLCALHPLAPGLPCRIFHPDGSATLAAFPDKIDPHQPFFDVAGMEWSAGPGLTARLRFEGEVFESEDQRNWSDASFKTYSTPQRFPQPVRVEAGEVFRHTIVLSFSGELPAFEADEAIVRIDLEGDPKPFVRWGLGWWPGDALTEEEKTWLKKLTPAHLRVAVGSDDDRSAVDQAAETGLPLRVDLSGERLPEWLPGHPAIKEVVHVSAKGWTTAGQLAGEIPADRRGGGTVGHFADLNRNPFDFSRVDFVSFTLTPTAHNPDTWTLFENLPAQGDQVRTASARSGKPVSIAHVTLFPRPEQPAAPDARQHTDLGVTWLIGSLKYLSEAGAESATFEDLAGPYGLIHNGQPTPAYQLFAFLSEFRPERVLPSRSSQPRVCSSLVLEKADGWKTTLLANHTDAPVDVRLPGATTVTLGPYEWKAIY